ncbi:MAG TPA: hypothetical protein VFS83_13355 [Ktedonobacterales bacterium]|nr:hypothetical protein [Ktedonobacterales bacterium]
MDEEQRTGMRLSTTATTGWTHWHHGELWLFEDGILRVPIGPLKSPLAVGYVAEQDNPCTHVFSAEEFNRLIADPHNLWIPREVIKSAVLRYSRGWAFDLRVQMSDGRSVQLLTLPWKRIYAPLQTALHEWLGEAFVAKPAWWLRE